MPRAPSARLPPLWSSLSGYVYNDGGQRRDQAGRRGGDRRRPVTLTGTDIGGNAVSVNATTDSLGAYSFSQLRPGTYTITETQPAGWLDGTDTQGTPGGGTAGNDVFTQHRACCRRQRPEQQLRRTAHAARHQLVKLTNGQHDPNVPAGSPVTWTYQVTNTGNVALGGVRQRRPGRDARLSSGDTNSNGLLDLGETWVYTATGTAVAGDYTNTGTATGTATDATGTVHTVVTDQDTDHYFGVQPGIELVKVHQRHARSERCRRQHGHLDLRRDATRATWPLDGVTVSDDQGVMPVYQSGDTNSNGMLDPGETWVYTATGTAIAPARSNERGTATGTDATGTVATPVSASATDGYFGVAAGHRVDEVDQRRRIIRTWPPAARSTWTYEVSNTGNVALGGVTSPTTRASRPSTRAAIPTATGCWTRAKSGSTRPRARPLPAYTNTATATGTDARARSPRRSPPATPTATSACSPGISVDEADQWHAQSERSPPAARSPGPTT